MSLARQVAHNTIIQLASKAVSTALGLWAIFIITRYLGPTGFGQYTTIITFLTFFAVAADFGLTLVTAQMISEPGVSEKKLINNLFSFRLSSALALLIMAPLVVSFFPYSQEIKYGVMITAVSFLFPALNQVLIGLFQKKLCMSRDAISEMIGRLILIAGLILTQSLEAGLNGILLATVVSAGVNFLFHYILSLEFVSVRWELDRLIWLRIISKSWPLAITIVLNLIYLRADTLLLSIFRSVEEVGLYGATYRIIDVLTTVPFMFAGIMLPILTTYWLTKKPEDFKKALQYAFDFMIILALPLAIGAQWFGDSIMLYAGGKDFVAAGPILKILIFGVAAIFPGTILSHAVIALDQQKKMIWFYVFTSFSALIAYLIFIPNFSYFGAAAVTVYSEIMIAIFSGYCVYKYGRFSPRWRTAGKALIASLFMGAFLFCFDPGQRPSILKFIWTFTSAVMVYLIAIYLIGGIKKSDLKKIIHYKGPANEGGATYTGTNI